MKNENLFITEISEEDFRKLNLKAYNRSWVKKEDGTKQLEWLEVDLNKELDENIAYWKGQGYESDLEDLKQPVTIAIHVKNGPNPEDFYLDKYMNRYTGAQTYQFAMGIRHLYSTRDYFETKGEDYWKVAKKETKAIYRIHLDEKHVKSFKLKHKTIISLRFSENHWVEDNYALENDEWVLKSRVEVEKTPYMTNYKPYNG